MSEIEARIHPQTAMERLRAAAAAITSNEEHVIVRAGDVRLLLRLVDGYPAAEYARGGAAERDRCVATIREYAEGCSDGPHRDVAFYLAEIIERSAPAEAAE